MLHLDTTTATVSGVGPTLRLHRDTREVEYELNVTAAATAVGDTLDVFVQSTVDNGVTWDDVVHFTQVLGNGGAKKFLARWAPDIAPTVPLAAPQDGALAAGVAQGPKGRTQRVKYVIVSASAPSFTFRVTSSARRAQ